jgi:putative endonuclease
MLKGWRIVGFRLKAGGTEIDLLAVRGKVLAVVEVKRRTSIESAIESVGPAQQAKLYRAAEQLAARKRGLSGLSVRLDMVALAPGRLPRHIPDAWRNGG